MTPRYKESPLPAILGAVISAALMAVFTLILFDLISKGLNEFSWTYLSGTPQNSGKSGGIFPILVSTLLILFICLLTVIPLGTAAAAWLAEGIRQKRQSARWISRLLDLLAGTPSIVFGLFGNAFFSLGLGMGFSILSGGLTLACMALPLYVKSAEDGLLRISAEQRMGAAALGLSAWRSFFRIEIPAALPALSAGLILSTGRALAETAALIFTSGYVDRMPSSFFDSGRALSVHLYDLAMNIPGGEARAAAAALLLIFILLFLNAATWALARPRNHTEISS